MQYNKDLIDGVNYINIGSTASTALGRLLSWFDPSPKRLHDGSTFYMYAGVYYYLITQGDNKRLLKAKTEQGLKSTRKTTWVNVISLETHLESLLLYNLRRSPLALTLIKQHDVPIYWFDYDHVAGNSHTLLPRERRWLRVVRRVCQRLRNEDEPLVETNDSYVTAKG